MDNETRDALRETYLFAFDGHGAVPTDLVDAEIANNPRHGRELLGILTGANLLIQDDVNGEGDVWVPSEDRDHVTRDQADSTIETWLDEHDDTSALVYESATPTPKKKGKTVTTSTEFKKCLCGCDENVPPKSTFRPGHDARMAGQIARQMVEDGGYDDELVATLPTEALRDKATAIFEKRNTKAQAKAAKADPTPEPEPVAAKKATPRKRSPRKATAKA